ncbi:MAG: DUF6049 family protein [Dermatophilaceae bacterium]
MRWRRASPRHRRSRFLAVCAALAALTLLPPPGVSDAALAACEAAGCDAQLAVVDGDRDVDVHLTDDTSPSAQGPAPIPADAASIGSGEAAYTAQVPYPALLPHTTRGADVNLRLDSVTPMVAAPGSAVHVQVTMTNTGNDAASDLRVRIRLGSRPLVSRADLDPTQVPDLPAVGLDSTPAVLAPGASVRVDLDIPPDQVPLTRSYGVLPLLVEAQRGNRTSTLWSFLPYEQVKEYEPLRLSLAMPLTPDPEPSVAAGDAATREAAWMSVLGPGSRIDRILTGTVGLPVTYVLDPILLGPGPPPAAATTPVGAARPTSSGTTTIASQAPVTDPAITAPAAPASAPPTSAPPTSAPPTSAPPTSAAAPTSPTSAAGAARTAFTTRLAAAARDHPLWTLPADDPDLAALAALAALAENAPSQHLFTDVLAPDPAVAAQVEPFSVSPIAWPQTLPAEDARRELVAAYGARQPGAWLVPRSAVQPPGGVGSTPRTLADGTRVLAYDDTLSRLLADSAAPGQGAALAQRFLAETLTMMQESPGTGRHVLLAAPRWVNPDQDSLRRLLGAVTSTPWVNLVPTTQLLTDTAFQGAAIAVPQPSAAVDDENPLASIGVAAESAASPLDGERIGQVERDLTRVEAIAEILPAGSTLGQDVARADRALLSTRWRGSPGRWQQMRGTVDGRVAAATGGVSVSPSQVNFFAETGTLQVTVVNTLDAEVHDVHLRLIPEGRVSRLRITEQQPLVLTIRPRSRATVKVAVEAIAPGVAPVRAELTTPSGARLSSERTVLDVHVQPMNGWLALVAGAVLGAVFLIGLLRAIRRDNPRVRAEELKEIEVV